jgi:hypothetical protein
LGRRDHRTGRASSQTGMWGRLVGIEADAGSRVAVWRGNAGETGLSEAPDRQQGGLAEAASRPGDEDTASGALPENS